MRLPILEFWQKNAQLYDGCGWVDFAAILPALWPPPQSAYASVDMQVAVGCLLTQRAIHVSAAHVYNYMYRDLCSNWVLTCQCYDVHMGPTFWSAGITPSIGMRTKTSKQIRAYREIFLQSWKWIAILLTILHYYTTDGLPQLRRLTWVSLEKHMLTRCVYVRAMLWFAPMISIFRMSICRYISLKS